MSPSIFVIYAILDAYKVSDVAECLRKQGRLGYYIQPLWDCFDVTQGSRHNETVYEHCLMAADFITYEYPLIRLAALLHDVGKPDTKRVEADGSVSFHGHETIGAQKAYEWMKNIGFSEHDSSYVSKLVKHHMFFFDKHASNKAYKRFARKTRGFRDELMMLRIADRAGNMAKLDRPLVTKQMLRLIDKCNEIDRQDQEPKLKLAINGYDLINMGYEPSKKFSKVIGKLMKRVQNKEMENNREELLAEVKVLMAL